MRSCAALLLIASVWIPAAAAQCTGPTRTIAGNFAADLAGAEHDPAGEHPGLWGRGDAWVWPLTFRNVPPGYRVRILRLSGDLTARFSTRGDGPAASTPGRFTGVLAGVTTKNPSQGSAYADWAADDTLAYIQGDIGADGAFRASFREDHAGVENAVLEADHKLYFKVAKYLDETAIPWTHLEITFSAIHFCYEDQP